MTEERRSDGAIQAQDGQGKDEDGRRAGQEDAAVAPADPGVPAAGDAAADEAVADEAVADEAIAGSQAADAHGCAPQQETRRDQEAAPPEAGGADEAQAGARAAEDTGGEALAAAPSAAEQLAVAQAELASLRQQLLRVHADFDNFRKRTRQEKEDLQKFAAQKLLSDLLPVVDNFERALAAFTAEGASAELRAGVEMVHRQLLGILEKHGVRPMDVVGQPFDPSLHEAVMQEPAGEGVAPGTVVLELQKGYWLHDKVLRPAMVKVSV
ncbi:hypothetical protein GCM10010885_18070 [Alicyclobacillus cellulosilyticus]|uniref:Protein GrpE n=1 Tax=Alicyclobacillus cellulosilyticus TaxID=1003997 RepID=A0A917KCN2_9BACL|nr:nucleotide exchange factor GrpE [Alicyclobacillus cellulosilyticus]GGJ09352.1 hypothetical protein GCM10010885_18070 [Alicyclobacillus cellulosilyticus]